MDAQERKNLVGWLENRISLDNQKDEIKIGFDKPTTEDFIAAGFSGEIVKLTLDTAW